MSLSDVAPVRARPAAVPGGRHRGRRSGIGGLSGLAASGLLAATGALFLLLAVGPHVLAYRTVTMRTASMSPLIPAGAVVVDVAEPVSAVRPGQVLTFHAPVPGAPVVTHQVVAVRHAPGGLLIRTRGVANPGPDPWTALVLGRSVWRERLVLPGLGWLVGGLRAPAGATVLRLLVVALLGWVLAGIWRGRPPAHAAAG